MNYKDLYKDILKQISGDICTRWPESGFSHATWADLAANCAHVYKALADIKNSMPQSVCLGRYAIKGADGEKVTLPYSWDWCKYRGIVLSPDAKYGEDVSNDLLAGIRKIAASFLLRLVAQSSGNINVYKAIMMPNVGMDIMMVPTDSKTTASGRSEIESLLKNIADQLKSPISDGWKYENPKEVKKSPICVVFIADWENLYDKDNNGSTKISNIQQDIINHMKNAYAAQNGIYFVICAANPIGLEGVTHIQVSERAGFYSGSLTRVMPSHTDGYPILKDNLSPVNLEFPIPSDGEWRAIHSAIANRDKMDIVEKLVEKDDVGTWEGNSSSGIKAPIGTFKLDEEDEDSATYPQYFELSEKTESFHALIGGGSGSGKSVLLNEIICSLSERYSPEEINLALLDYKQGAEFAPYEHLPHVFALSMGPDVEFGYELLSWLYSEHVRRNQMFTAADVKDLENYRKKTGHKLCRFVVIADEFQVLTTDERFGNGARDLFMKLTKEARSTGIHVILSTQALNNDCLDQAARAQMKCRICLKIDENQASYFLANNNKITEQAEFHQKPIGTAVINYLAGQKEGNKIFRGGYKSRDEVNALVDTLRRRSLDENLELNNRYIYKNDDPVVITHDMLDIEKGFIIGVRTNLTSEPFFLEKRRVEQGIVIVGKEIENIKRVLRAISVQTQAMYGITCPIMSTQQYLNRMQDYPLTILYAEERDFDLEAAITEWVETYEQQETGSTLDVSEPATPQYPVFEGMEEEQKELMSSMNFNFGGNASAPKSRKARKQKTYPLVIALPTYNDANKLKDIMIDMKSLLDNLLVRIYADYTSYENMAPQPKKVSMVSSQVLIDLSHDGDVCKIRVGEI